MLKPIQVAVDEKEGVLVQPILQAKGSGGLDVREWSHAEDREIITSQLAVSARVSHHGRMLCMVFLISSLLNP